VPNRTLLLSIKPTYTNKIFAGTKTVELRRTRPGVMRGDTALIYESSPSKMLSGFFKVGGIISDTPDQLWIRVQSEAGVSKDDFDKYYLGAKEAFGIRIEHVTRLQQPIELNELRELLPGFTPPQSFRYVTDGLLPSIYSVINDWNNKPTNFLDGFVAKAFLKTYPTYGYY
jgi:predicted transcriptional regulator